MTRTTPSLADGLLVQRLHVVMGGITALDGVDLTVERGTIHAVIGPNGAGKSSLLNAICGIYPFDQGTISWAGQSIGARTQRQIARAGVARTFQNIVISPHESVLDNLLVGRHRLTTAGALSSIFGLDRKAERIHTARAVEIAHITGLGAVLDSPAGSLDYGALKRLELARALNLEPDLLLLDEPVAGMNADDSAEFAALVAALRGDLDLTVVLIEHDIPLVFALADGVTVLDHGKRIATGSPEAIKSDNAVLEAYLGMPQSAGHHGDQSGRNADHAPA
ncbi:ABC transporter ATP-binding protein [Rhodococcus sp. T7]|uniref:ABC transporter ATP-binding protein n=1 Tax=Rhodococcus sp. T7 TaxID=627444 RepID=UPI0013585BA9|nr:ATP-binding cassette domain-containing protein [Rhodococcus sp. T7]KAF0960270.1 Fructose import ATP-binding protein FrcA [Rhodococcus sp. T7]